MLGIPESILLQADKVISMIRSPFALVVVALILAATGSSPMRAEEPSQRVVRLGFVGPLSPATHKFTPFWERLRQLGWVEGQNLVVESRSAEGRLDWLPALSWPR